jgi:predicted lipid-binding transport protein (Tim44 family)
MLRTRLVRLPVIPLSILIGIYEFGAVSAAIGASVDTATAQADVFLTTESAMPRALGERSQSPSFGAEQPARFPGFLYASPAEPATEDASKPPKVKSENAPPGSEPAKTPSRGAPAVHREPAANPNTQPKNAPSILQMLQGHDREVLFGVTIAAAFFFLGWFSGGNYYLRRERRRRTKLRF